MGALTCINDYLKIYGAELGHRVVDQFPPLHQPSDPVWPAINELKRNPFPAQALAIMGIVKRWEEARCAAAVAECGTGKTLQSAQLAFGLFADFFGQVGFLEPLPQSRHFRLFGGLLSQLLLNGPKLLAKQILSLLFGHFVPRCRRDLLTQLQYL